MANRLTASEYADEIVRFYHLPDNGAGGRCCHVVLDDSNIDDFFVASAWLNAIDQGDYSAAVMMRAFLELSKTQRKKAIALSRIRGRYR